MKVVVIIVLAACFSGSLASHYAHCQVHGTDGISHGHICLKQEEDLHVKIHLTDLPKCNSFKIHVHENPSTDKCTGHGNHFNPTTHESDEGNLDTVESNYVGMVHDYSKISKHLSLKGILGKSIVIHIGSGHHSSKICCNIKKSDNKMYKQMIKDGKQDMSHHGHANCPEVPPAS